jgi:hypothetical protein
MMNVAIVSGDDDAVIVSVAAAQAGDYHDSCAIAFDGAVRSCAMLRVAVLAGDQRQQRA